MYVTTSFNDYKSEILLPKSTLVLIHPSYIYHATEELAEPTEKWLRKIDGYSMFQVHKPERLLYYPYALDCVVVQVYISDLEDCGYPETNDYFVPLINVGSITSTDPTRSGDYPPSKLRTIFTKELIYNDRSFY